MKSVMGTDMQWEKMCESSKANVTAWFEIAKKVGMDVGIPVEQWLDLPECDFAHEIACWAWKEKARHTKKTQEEIENLCTQSCKEWFEKTEWVQKKRDWPFNHLGMHIADAMKKYIDYLEAENQKLKGISR